MRSSTKGKMACTCNLARDTPNVLAILNKLLTPAIRMHCHFEIAITKQELKQTSQRYHVWRQLPVYCPRKPESASTQARQSLGGRHQRPRRRTCSARLSRSNSPPSLGRSHHHHNTGCRTDNKGAHFPFSSRNVQEI